jgi:integrase
MVVRPITKLSERLIADQLGHSDVSMTARAYLGHDLKGDKRDLARVL